MSYDLIVIGGGAAGLDAARSALRQGARTLVVQEGELGGDCTLSGCIPGRRSYLPAPFDLAIESEWCPHPSEQRARTPIYDNTS